MVFDNIRRWLARDAYKVMQATDTERKAVQEALGMDETEIKEIKDIESATRDVYEEAKLTEGKILSLAAKMEITKRHTQAELILGKHMGTLTAAINQLGGKQVTSLEIGVREELRKTLVQLQTDFNGLLATAEQIKKEAEEEVKAGEEVVSGISTQIHDLKLVAKAYLRVKRAAKKVVTGLENVKAKAEQVSASTMDEQTRLNKELNKYREKPQEAA